MPFVNDFNNLCHFELEQISKVDPAMTFVNDFNRFCHFYLQQMYRGGGRVLAEIYKGGGQGSDHPSKSTIKRL